ncbi:hypothetical protein AGMMS49982_19930 [Bacteroidia bacterium]|nr:hypothetical protein AGMMS49982_19930 [Bacteroidia bacterium]
MKTIYCSFIACLFLLSSCEEKSLEPTIKSLGKPGAVAEATITKTPIAGGVVIKYRVPDAEDILEVRAAYTLPNGQQREESASFYANQLTLEGFNDTNEHEALLYAVNRAQEKSDLVSVKFTPLESSLSKAAKTVQIITGFGGPTFIWENPDRAALAFELLTEDETSTLRPANILTSTLASTQYTLRGYEPKPRKFGLIIRDNWGNASDIIQPAEGPITPRVEEKLDKSIMSILILPSSGAGNKGDTPFTGWGARNESLINDNIDDNGHTAGNTMPEASFTLNLGVSTTLSRVVLHQRRDAFGTAGEWYYYNFGNPKTFTVYGSNSETVPSSDWSEWTNIADFELIKPSGLGGNEFSADDRAAADAGHDFDFPQGIGAFRFLRFQFHSIWNDAATYVHISEVTTYGASVE